MDLFPNLLFTFTDVSSKSNNVCNIVTRTLEVSIRTLMRPTVIGVDNLCLTLNPKCYHKC